MMKDTQVNCAETQEKPFLKSNTNKVGLALVLMSMISDPSFQVLFGDLMPQPWFSRAVFVAGWAILGLRTLKPGTTISRNWKMPWEAK